MVNKISVLVLLFIIPFHLRSQIFPKENAKLNYRIIGFSFPAKNKYHYKVEIAAGHYNSADSFTNNIVNTVKSDTDRVIAVVPAFGSEYTWRVVYIGKQKEKHGLLYHFNTITNRRVDTSKLRLKILQQAVESYHDYYVSVDAGSVLYDMRGEPVWCVPDSVGRGGNASDLMFTKEGTVTFMSLDAYEINYNGDILWKAPNNGVVNGEKKRGELYHHEFTKLSNGHYMILGMEFKTCKSVIRKDTSYILVSDDQEEHDGYKKARFGNIIEYDSKGNVVWSWRSKDHLLGSDFDYANSLDSIIRFDPHDNAFYFDEKNSVIYLGFRNLNRILKIEYPVGKILRVYGDRYKPGLPEVGKGLFCNQHSIGRSQDGYLYIFNNNSCMLRDSMPTVVMLKEPISASDTFQKIWEYTCSVEREFPEGFRRIFISGGNAKELADRSMYVNMSSEYSKFFLVDRGKQVLWSALPERFMEPDDKWVPIHEYRSDIISRGQLEQMIWKAQEKK
jgi:hypothetical protein